MFGLPLSWILIAAGIAALAAYIGILKLKAARAEKRAAAAAQERDNARIMQHTTKQAQDAEHAYQDASAAVLNTTESKKGGAGQGEREPAADSPSSASGPDQGHLDRLKQVNKMFPAMLLVLLLSACATVPPAVVASNPAAQVVIPAAPANVPVHFFEVTGESGAAYCLDDDNAAALHQNILQLKARIAGLEAALRSLGVTVK